MSRHSSPCHDVRAALAASLALLLAACGGGHHGHSKKPYDPTIREVEPNGSAATANGIGPIRPGDAYLIRGHITDFGPDVFDGFAFVSEFPLELEFVLTADHPAADLDLCVYDPFLGEVVACFENPWNPEVGFVAVLDAGIEFHLVVSSFLGTTGYTLEVFGHHLEVAPEAAAQGAEPRRLVPRKHTEDSRREAFWRAYVSAPVAAAEPAEEDEAPETVRGLVVTADPATGEVRRQPYLRAGDRFLFLED